MIDKMDYLLDSLKNGDRVSFEKIYKSFYPLLYNYGRQFGLDESDIDDSIQMVFIEIWNSRNLLNIKVLKPYLFTCLRNKITKSLSRNLKENSKAEKYWREEFKVSYHPSVEEIEFQNKTDLEKNLINSIEQLSPKQREIIYLIFYNNLSYLEVAEVLGVKIKTVYNQVHNSINSIRESLKLLLLGIVFFFIIV